VVDVASQTHAEPGDWKSNTGVGTISTGSTAQTLSDYFTAADDMRTIAFNLASAVEGGKFYFDNFVFKVVQEEEADIKAYTQSWDESSKWNETLALNVAYDKGRNAETEGCTEESVKALTDAMAAGKAILQPAEGAEPVTKDAIAAAAKAIEDAIAGLTKGEGDEFIEKPALDGSYIEIAQTPAVGFGNATAEAGEYKGAAYTSYTTVDQYNVAFKMLDVDVTGCDKIYFYFAQPLPTGWYKAFWGKQEDVEEIPAGTQFVEFDLNDKFNDTDVATYEQDGKTYIKEITMISLWTAPTSGLNAKVYGVYKHVNDATAISEVAEDAALKDGKYFIDGQIVIVKGGKKFTAAGVEIK
jgi:hypothetical protein